MDKVTLSITTILFFEDDKESFLFSHTGPLKTRAIRVWGFPLDEDMRLFEKICLESFQSGLSWRTILAKRDNFREAFHHFDFIDFKRISKFKEEDCAFCKKSAKVTPALKTPDEVVMLQRK